MRFFITLISSMALGILLATLARAQTDTSSPNAALKSFYIAIEKADQAAITQVLLVPDDPQQEIAKAYASMLLAAKRFGDVARQKFPGVANSLAQAALAPEDLARLDAAVVTIDGDTATVRISPAGTPSVLKRVDGAWRVTVDPIDPASAPNRAQQLALIQGLSDAITKSAAEMSDDKYGSIQDVENALKQRMGVVLNKALQANPPTSRPTSVPG
jgi:hypothetical protein